jgi:hypothetical protein
MARRVRLADLPECNKCKGVLGACVCTVFDHVFQDGLRCSGCGGVGHLVANKCTACGKWQSLRGHRKGARLHWTPRHQQ